MNNIINTKIFQDLENLNTEFKKLKLIEHFHQDTERVSKFSITFGEFYYDYSKNYINQEIFDKLIELLDLAEFEKYKQDLLSAKKFNFTENREVLHFALRYNQNDPEKYQFNNIIGGVDILDEINQVKSKMKDFTDKVRNGKWKGYNGKSIKYIINIGIGGSDLGPKFVVNALQNFNDSEIQTFFVSNIDPTDLIQTIRKVNLEDTLFVIASKTFTTLETISNANLAKSIFLEHTQQGDEAISKHFVALSTNKQKCKEFGIPEENLFAFWDWVGGRFSLWSAIGLSISLSIGWDNFELLLEGAYTADKHFFTTPATHNIPILMALIGVLYRNFYQFESYAVIPYSQTLSLLTEYLQQLEMESNGKYINRNNEIVKHATSPNIWGTAGTNAQHSYFQLLHQGTTITPIDFIAFKEPNINSQFDDNINSQIIENHKLLLSNFIAQTEALMIGKSYDEVLNELNTQNQQSDFISNENLAKHKTFEGNRPTSTILIDKLTPKTLGTLIAFYEHKVFTQGVIWNVNSFDQWGVELGKVLAKVIKADIDNQGNINSNHDSSTSAIIDKIK